MAARQRFVALSRLPVVWPVTALAVLLLVAIGVVSALAGPAEFGEPRFAPFNDLVDAPEDGSLAPPPPAAEEPAAEAEGLPGWTWVAWSLLVVAMTVLVVRSVFSWLAAGGAEPATEDLPGDASGGHLLAAVRRGLREADEELGSAVSGREDDAVIRCWLALEDAASHVGTRRDRAQTPTEFTTSLLQSQAADEDATRTLLALYHRARYGSSPVGAEAVPQAQQALERIAASLRDEPRVDRGGRRG